MKRFLSTSALLGIQPFITKLIAYFVIPLYTLTLTPYEYGNVEFILAIGVFFKTFISMSTTSSFWKYINDDQLYNSKVVIFNITAIPLFLGFITIIFGVGLFTLFPMGSVNPKNLLIYCLSETITVLYMVANLVIRNDFHPRKFLLITFLYVTVFIGSNFFFLSHLGLKENGVFLSYLTSALLVGVGSIYIIRKYIVFEFNLTLIKDILKYSYPLMVTNLIAIVIAFSDRILIKYFRDGHELGLYSYGFKFGSIVKSVLIDVFFIIWNPIRWKIYKSENGREVFSLFSRLLLLLFVLFGFLFTIGSDFLGRILSSNEIYLEGLFIIPLITFGYVFYGFYYFSIMGLLFKDKTPIIVRIVSLLSVFNVTLNILLLSQIGFIGSAISMFITYMIMAIYGFFQSQKFYAIAPLRFKNFILVCGYLVGYYVIHYSTDLSTYAFNFFSFIVVFAFNYKEIQYIRSNLHIIKKSLQNVY